MSVPPAGVLPFDSIASMRNFTHSRLSATEFGIIFEPRRNQNAKSPTSQFEYRIEFAPTDGLAGLNRLNDNLQQANRYSADPYLASGFVGL